MNVRITERDLILPSLYLMQTYGGSITVTHLIQELRSLMKPPAEDLEQLDGRNDDKFSQKVRNLKSHNTLENLGYAEHSEGVFVITHRGTQYLNENIEVSRLTLNNEFSFEEKENILLKARLSLPDNPLQVFNENVSITEGTRSVKERVIYERSKKLRDFAIAHFLMLGPLACRCCGFIFEQKYGAHGTGYIEIHHIKPVSKFKNEEIKQAIRQAMVNLVPLCSNCHRMIHKNWAKPLSVEKLMEIIEHPN